MTTRMDYYAAVKALSPEVRKLVSEALFATAEAIGDLDRGRSLALYEVAATLRDGEWRIPPGACVDWSHLPVKEQWK